MTRAKAGDAIPRLWHAELSNDPGKGRLAIGKRLKMLPGLVSALLSIRPSAIGGLQWNWLLRAGK